MILAFDQWLHVQLAQLHGWEVYLLAVLAFSGLYFGSVGIKKVRNAIWAGMLADFIGVIAAVIIAYFFFGK